MRQTNIDVLRGIVMIFMCIDHARDYTYFHPADPMILEDTSFAVYVLRMLAHLCAPAFILLAGISARLSGAKKTKKELSHYLFTRGIILCLLEVTLVNWAWSFNPTYHLIYLQIIWAIGISMIALSLLIFLKNKYILILSVLILAGHNLFDGVSFEQGTIMYYIWSFLLQKNVLPITDYLSVRTTYPVLPVIGVISLGYVLGTIYLEKSSFQRQKWFVSMGVVLLSAYLVLRLWIGYGDLSKMEYSDNLLLTLMSVFNVTKYPFSLQFILITLSVIFFYLGFTDQYKGGAKTMLLEVFGKTPMFFYILHIYILHSIVLIVVVLQRGTINLSDSLGGVPSDFGVPLWWLLWIVPLTLAILYPLCNRYLEVKMSRKYKWTRYI